MLYLLLLILFIEYCFGLLIFKEDIGTPSLIVSAVMMFSVLIGIIGNNLYWQTDIHPNTVYIIGISIFFIIMGDRLSANIFYKRLSHLVDNESVFKIEKWKLVLIILGGIITIVLQYINLYQNTGSGDLSDILFQYRLLYNAGELEYVTTVGSDPNVVTKMVENLLEGIEVRLNTDYLIHKEELDTLAKKVIYTGPIDAYFDYKLGYLEYRSVRFETEVLDKPNFQGNAAVNYTDRETPWTRIIEHKWFEFGKDEDGKELEKTVISREYSSEWKPGDEPYYPVNDEKNGALYRKYKELADKEENVIFGGRLGEYKYYDMDAVIASVLGKCKKEL